MAKPNAIMRGLAAIGYVTLSDESSQEDAPAAAPQPPRNPAPARPPVAGPPLQYVNQPYAQPAPYAQPQGSYAPPGPVMTPELSARIQTLDKNAQDRLVHVMANDGAPRVEEMMDTLETLGDAVPDERARYIAALRLLIKRGSTVPVILQDYVLCLTALDTNYKQFETETEGAVKSKVGSKIAAVEGFNQQLEAKAAQIAALQQEMHELAAQRDQEQAGISEAERDIEMVKSRFNHVYTSIRSAVETQRNKISTYGAGL